VNIVGLCYILCLVLVLSVRCSESISEVYVPVQVKEGCALLEPESNSTASS